MKPIWLLFTLGICINNAAEAFLRASLVKKKKYIAQVISQRYYQAKKWVGKNHIFVERCALLGALGIGGYWWWYATRNRIITPPFEPMRLKDAPVRGATQEYRDVVIVQVEVKNQFDADAGDGEANCAYQAINNAEAVVGSLTGRIKNLLRALFNLDKIERRFGDDGTWRKKIQRLRPMRKNGEPSSGNWLRGQEIDALMHRKTEVPRHPYDVIDDIQMIGLDEGRADLIVPEVKQNLLQAKQQRKEYIHQFFINTAHHHQTGDKGEVKGSDGHWFAVVLHQSSEGERTYVVADSYGNATRLNDYYVKKLVDGIEDACQVLENKD